MGLALSFKFVIKWECLNNKYYFLKRHHLSAYFFFLLQGLVLPPSTCDLQALTNEIRDLKTKNHRCGDGRTYFIKIHAENKKKWRDSLKI